MEQKKCKTGYLSGIFEKLDYSDLLLLQNCKDYCDRLIVGILSDDLVYRMTDRPSKFSFEHRKALLEALKIVDEVIEVGWDNIIKQDSHRQIGYDVCFVGTEYGRLYTEDKSYFETKGVDIVSFPSEALCRDPLPMTEALENVHFDRQIVLFGTGKYFEYYMNTFGEKYPPAYAVDNSKELWGSTKLGVEIKNPKVLETADCGKVLVVLCCKDYAPISAQLREMGNFDYRPMRYQPGPALIDEYAVILWEERQFLAKAHDALMKLLIEFDRVCRKYHLRYFLICGSLIGAVRHHGFIPWDDDADVAMFREDFDILKEHAEEIWENTDFTFVDYDQIGNGLFLDYLARLVYMKEEVPNNIFTKCADKMTNNIANHMVLDIYVLDKASDTEWKHRLLINLIRGVYGLGMGHRARIDYTMYKNESIGTRFVIGCTSMLGKMIPLRVICCLYEKLRRWNNKKECDFYYKSNGWTKVIHWKYDKKLFGEGTYLDVNGYPIMVPEKYEEYLEIGYHNFMSYPPANDRKPKHSVNSPDII